MIGLVAKSGIQLNFWGPSVHKSSGALKTFAFARGCEMSVIADFKGIIQQVSVNKDLRTVYAIFEGGDGSDEVLTGVIICGTLNAAFRQRQHCVQSLKMKNLT